MKNSLLKKTGLLFVALCMLFSLFACGVSENNTSGDDSKDDGSNATAVGGQVGVHFQGAQGGFTAKCEELPNGKLAYNVPHCRWEDDGSSKYKVDFYIGTNELPKDNASAKLYMTVIPESGVANERILLKEYDDISTEDYSYTSKPADDGETLVFDFSFNDYVLVSPSDIPDEGVGRVILEIEGAFEDSVTFWYYRTSWDHVFDGRVIDTYKWVEIYESAEDIVIDGKSPSVSDSGEIEMVPAKNAEYAISGGTYMNYFEPSLAYCAFSSNKTTFNANAVTLKFYYAQNTADPDAANSAELYFKNPRNDALTAYVKRVNDFKSAKYGYTVSATDSGYGNINYKYSELLTIPEELFVGTDGKIVFSIENLGCEVSIYYLRDGDTVTLYDPYGKYMSAQYSPVRVLSVDDWSFDKWILDEYDAEYFNNSLAARLWDFGPAAYYDSAYGTKDEAEIPEQYVAYAVEVFYREDPERYEDKFVTYIEITDPTVTLFGVSLKSSPEEIIEALENYGGFYISYNEQNKNVVAWKGIFKIMFRLEALSEDIPAKIVIETYYVTDNHVMLPHPVIYG